MRKTTTAAITAIALLAGMTTPAQAISGGTSIQPDDPIAPAVVKINYHNQEKNTQFTICTGSLITAPNVDTESRYVLTARHCLNDKTGKPIPEPHGNTSTPQVNDGVGDRETGIPQQGVLTGLPQWAEVLIMYLVGASVSLSIGIPLFQWLLPKWTQGVVAGDDLGSSEPVWSTDRSDKPRVDGLFVVDSKHFEHAVVDYHYAPHNGDMVILELLTPARGITPLHISRTPFTVGDHMEGYGAGPAGNLRTAHAIIKENGWNLAYNCITSYYTNGNIIGGDSGGPLVNSDGDINAINVSWVGNMEYEGNTHKLMSSVPTTHYYDWILNTINGR